MEQYEQALRIERAAAVRAQRGAAEKVSEAEGLQDAAAAVLVAAEQEEKDAGAASAAAETAARAFAASLGIDKRLVRPGVGTISSPYGMRRHPITGAHKLHSGTDFQHADGKAYAAASGTVAAVTRDSAYGNMVTIAHGHGITTRYAHLARPLVRPGDEVAAAQVIGQIGSTGLSTGAHLHFEVQVGGEFQDPAVWLAR
jgi:murein DD-endopeptidase MepM/ murein hydrolase activator NlpD